MHLLWQVYNSVQRITCWFYKTINIHLFVFKNIEILKQSHFHWNGYPLIFTLRLLEVYIIHWLLFLFFDCILLLLYINWMYALAFEIITFSLTKANVILLQFITTKRLIINLYRKRFTSDEILSLVMIGLNFCVVLHFNLVFVQFPCRNIIVTNHHLISYLCYFFLTIYYSGNKLLS